MKKHWFLIIFILFASLPGSGCTGPGSDETAFQVQAGSSQQNFVSVYQDNEWCANAQKNLKLLKADFDIVSSAVNNSDYTLLETSAQYVINDTKKAVEENDQYKVSPELQNVQDEWKLALKDYNYAGRFLLLGANEAKSGNNGSESLQAAKKFSDSGATHLNRASALLG